MDGQMKFETQLLTALYAAETMLAKLPDVTTNWNGQRPAMSMRRALELVRAALARATKER